jgi:methionyl-tRNA formyltransferase
MTKISEKIVFFGSGPVAAESLGLLLDSFDIDAVITKPRPAHHKGAVPVLELAEEHGLNTFTVGTKSELNMLMDSRPVRSRLAVLVDFGIIVSQQVIDYFELGIVNSHFSLLPQWRGADPITFSILSGQKKTGVSLMLLSAGMDEGPLLSQTEYDIKPDETTPSLTEALVELSDASLKHILPLYVAGNVHPTPQDSEQQPTYSRKLTKADGVLDTRKSADELEREIRAFLGWPGSRLAIDTMEIIITKARAAMVPTSMKPGTFEALSSPSTLVLYCGQGYLSIERLKPAGKREMDAQEFLRGYGSRLGI